MALENIQNLENRTAQKISHIFMRQEKNLQVEIKAPMYLVIKALIIL